MALYESMESQTTSDSGVEILPGTEIMTDVAGTHFVHAHNSTDSAVLIPQPSNNSNDPLVSYFFRPRLFTHKTLMTQRTGVHVGSIP